MARYNPTLRQCIEQWQHNREFIGSIEPKHHDWIITATLYTALHAVEALLVADQAPGHATHAQRHQLLESNPRYSSGIYPSYKVMYDLAHVTRYSAMPRKWVRYTDLNGVIFTRCLYPVEEEVRLLLGSLKSPINIAPFPPIVLKPPVISVIATL